MKQKNFANNSPEQALKDSDDSEEVVVVTNSATLSEDRRTDMTKEVKQDLLNKCKI